MPFPGYRQPGSIRGAAPHAEVWGSDCNSQAPFTPLLPAEVDDDMGFSEMCETLKTYFTQNIDVAVDSANLKRSSVVHKLASQLTYQSHNPTTLAALLWCRAQFISIDVDETGGGLGTCRALACELVACELVSNLSAVEALQYLCYEVPTDESTAPDDGTITEATPLRYGTSSGSGGDSEEHAAGTEPKYVGLNTLEIAVLADAKKFISHPPVQRIITGIWDGSISFWKSLDVCGSKQPHFYNARKRDPFCRLRVPRYQKIFEALFFAVLLALYYSVLYERNPFRITGSEVALAVFFVAFLVDELSAMKDSGVSLYAQDFWSWMDMGLIVIGVAFLITRILGLVKASEDITDTAFDILSLEALLLVPRIFSLLSLHPYFGVLIPCLKRLTFEFVKFLVLVVILHVGFLTTFSLLARDRMSVNQTSWMLIKVFFGATNVGFDAMREISPVLGPPLMLIFVTMTNILLITSLISLLSISLSKMMSNAREEYLYMFSVMVLEASTSSRLVVYYPPLNLLPLILLRPLRLIMPAWRIRGWRIALLKFSHFPFVAAIMAYERLTKDREARTAASWGPMSTSGSKNPLGLGLMSLGHQRQMEWSNGRLLGAGARLRSGGVGGGAGGHHHPATTTTTAVVVEPSIDGLSARMDAENRSCASAPESAFERRAPPVAPQFTNEDQMELGRMRVTLEELTRKLDAMLERAAAAAVTVPPS